MHFKTLFLLTLAGLGSAHAAGTSDNDARDVSPILSIDRGAVDQAHDAFADKTNDDEYPTIDGSNNNLAHPDMGAAHTGLARWMSPDYADGASDMAVPDGTPARVISNAVFDQRRSFANRQAASDFLWQWGQFVDHDIDLTDGTSPPEPAPVAIPVGDPWFDPDQTGSVVLAFNRSLYMEGSGTDASNPRQQVNEITAWIDASNVYGSNLVRASALRRLDGSGELRLSDDGFLPYNLGGLPNAGGSGPDLFLAGDVRANEQVGLTAMHTLFAREHNRLARELVTDEPDLDGEQIYQRARRLVAAQIQAITYNEFLPLLLGPNAIGPYAGYRPAIDSSIANIFSTGAYRLGHSMLSPQLLRLDVTGNEVDAGHLALRDAFFSPSRLHDEGGIEPLLRGLAAQVCQSIDTQVIDDVRNFLFGPPGAGGFDLVSLNIQRGRDHGLPRYNATRELLGMGAYQSFEQISDDPTVASALESVYPSIDDVDLWVGVLAETHHPDALVGELGRFILKKQFRALRDGDRYWYQRTLDADELAWVQATKLADVIRRNAQIGSEISDDVFRVANVADQDNDAIGDPWDNCTQHANHDQRDTDNDGYGNRCDADLNNDGRVNATDLGYFRMAFGGSGPHADFDGDGAVNSQDLGMFRALFFRSPGPSGQIL